MTDCGRFQDEDPEPIEPMELEAHTWDETDEADRRYDLMVEDQFDRHAWPSNQDRFLTGLSGEDEMERARRRAPIMGRVA